MSSSSENQAGTAPVVISVRDYAFVQECLRAGEGRGVLYFALNLSEEIPELADCVELNLARTGCDPKNFALVDRFAGVVRYRAFFLWHSIRNKLLQDNASAVAIATVEAGFDPSTEPSVARVLKNRLSFYTAEELHENSNSYDDDEDYAKLLRQLKLFYKEYDQAVRHMGECSSRQWFVLQDALPTGVTLTMAIRHSDPQQNNPPEILIIIDHEKWTDAEELKVLETDLEFNCDSFLAR
jgi:hypothetical protein